MIPAPDAYKASALTNDELVSYKFLVEVDGLEPTTSGLQSRCSTN